MSRSQLLAIVGWLLVAVSAAMAQGTKPCQSSNSAKANVPGTTLSGLLVLSKDTCISTQTLTLKSDLFLITNGFALEIETEKLVAEKGARIEAYDYGAEAILSHKSVGSNIDYVFPRSYDPGPNTEGYSQGDGRHGGDAAPASGIADGRPGAPGKSPRLIAVRSKATASGVITIISRGTAGLRGQDGHRAYTAGSGEQGRIGQRDALGLCGAGPGHGGNGGTGGTGGAGGVGGTGGSGGDVIVDVPNGSRFVVQLDTSAGEGGLPGTPGPTSRGGLQGCGGRGGPCTQKIWTLQGFRGEAGTTKRLSAIGVESSPGKVQVKNAQIVPVDDRLVCTPFTPPQGIDRVELDRLQLMAFLGAIASDSFGSDSRTLDTSDGATFQILDVYRVPPWLAVVDREQVARYTSTPPPVPQIPAPTCRNADCCKPTPWLGCLQPALWDFDSSSPRTRYETARVAWLQTLQKALAIEISRSSFIGTEADLVARAKVGETWMNWTPISNSSSTYTRLDGALLARLAVVVSEGLPSVRRALHLPSPVHADALLCTSSDVIAAGPGAKADGTGYSLINVGPIEPVALNGPNPTPSYFVLPVRFHGSELIFEKPILSGGPIQTAGFENTQYCDLASAMHRSPFTRPFSCSPGDHQINEFILAVGRDIDFPGPITALFVVKYIQAALASLPADIPSYFNRMFHCPAQPPADAG